MQTLSLPLRLDSQGHIVTVTQGSDEHAAELVAMLALTRKGERPLAPDFGITDPTFGALDSAELAVAVATFGPEGVRVAVADEQQIDESTRAYSITIERE